MKKALLLSSCFILGLGMSAYTQAQTDTSTTTTTTTSITKRAHGHEHARNHRACMAIAVACENAGYKLSRMVPGKNIWKDCVKPVTEGKTISGVKVEPAAIHECKEHVEHMKGHMKELKMRHEKNMHNKQEAPASTTAPASTAAPASTTAPATNQ